MFRRLDLTVSVAKAVAAVFSRCSVLHLVDERNLCAAPAPAVAISDCTARMQGLECGDLNAD
jgi:hypothetical protein